MSNVSFWRRRHGRLALVLLLVGGGCTSARAAGDPAPARSAPPRSVNIQAATTLGMPALPPGSADAEARLAASPRHGEWAVIRTGPADSVRAWVVFPERAERAPVVLVVHEIFGLSNWVRAVADQLAAQGFLAIAPDLLTMKNLPLAADGAPNPDSARAAIRTLNADDVHRQLRTVARYGMALPAARSSYGVLGFCWGGMVAFEHAARAPELGAAVVFYGTSPATGALAAVRAPVLGLYGEDDARVNATIPPADSAMRALGKPFRYQVYPGAGHGFVRAQEGRDGANAAATAAAWPLAVQWLQTYLGNR